MSCIKFLIFTTLLQTNKRSTRVPKCKNGSSCDWLKRGVCSYFHERVGVQKSWVSKEKRHDGDHQENHSRRDARPHQERQPQQGTRPRLAQSRNHSPEQQDRQSQCAICRHDGRSDRIPNCPHLHIESLKDFPLFQGRRNQTIRRTQNPRRN